MRQFAITVHIRALTGQADTADVHLGKLPADDIAAVEAAVRTLEPQIAAALNPDGKVEGGGVAVA
jgi:hypothetical protein